MKIIFRITRILFLIQFALILMTPAALTAEKIPGVVLSAKGYILKNDFYSVASQYLLPTYFSDSEISEERESITNALNLLSKEFGNIDGMQTNQDDVRWVNLEIFGGDVDFIKEHPDFIQYVFKTKFSILGNGFIIIRVYENNGNLKLRSVGYALPESSQTREKLQPKKKKLMQLMFP